MKLASLSAEKLKLEEKLVSGAVHTELASIGKRLKELQNEIEEHENQWMLLQESLEKA